MATNSDGAIVLSVTVDSSKVSSDIKKVVNEINKQVQAEAKNLQAVESINQAKEKTAQQQAKTNREIYNELEAEAKALTAEQNLATAKEKNAQTQAKTVVEEEKTAQAELKTQQEQQKILLNEQKIAQEVEKTRQAQEKTTQEVIRTEKAQKSLQNATSSITKALSQMASQLGIAFGVAQIVRFSKEAGELASQTESYLARLSVLYGENAQNVYDWANENANALGMAKSEAYEAAATYGNLFSAFADAKQSSELSIKLLQATAVVASQTGRTYDETFQKIQSGIYGNTRAIDDLGISVRKASLMQTQAYQQIAGAGAKWNDLTDAQLQQIRVLAILEQSQNKYGNSVLQTTALARSQFNAAWTDFKATWGAVINAILMPILKVATMLLNTLTSIMNKLLGIKNITTNTMDSSKESIDSTTDSQENLTDEIKETEKEQQRLLAGFDDLEILSSSISKNLDKDSLIPETIKPATTQDNTGDLAKQTQTSMAQIGLLAGAALVGLGLVLLISTPHKLLALGMIGLGAYEVYTSVQELKQSLGEEEKKKLSEIAMLVGLPLLCLGIFLLFTPWFGVGLYMIGLGAASVYSAVSLTGFTEDIKELVVDIIAIIGEVAVVIGIILLFIPGCLAYGLGLIATGIVAYGITRDLGAPNIGETLKTLADSEYSGLFSIATLMVVIGIVLMFVPSVGTGVGIAMIALGIGTLVAATNLENNKDLQENLKSLAQENWEIIYTVATICVVLGIILMFTTNFGLGITLFLTGAATLITATKLIGDHIPKELKEIMSQVYEDITTIASVLFIVGILAVCTGEGMLLGLKMILIAAVSLYVASELTDVPITKAINDTLLKCSKIVTATGAILLVIGILLCLTEAGFAIGLKMILMGALALFSGLAIQHNLISDTVDGELGAATTIATAGVKKVNKELEETGNVEIKSNISGQVDSDMSDAYSSAENWVKKINSKISEISTTKTVNIQTNYTESGSGISTLNVPALARGAVLPANRPFLTVVGDQKHGTNIEAPADLIKQKVMEAYNEIGPVQNQQQIIEKHYYIGKRELAKVIYDAVLEGKNQRGNSFVVDGVNI